MARFNALITPTAGTPINLSTLDVTGDVIPRLVKRVLIQPAPSATSGIVYVMDGIYGVANGAPRVPSNSNAGDVTAYLAAATATAPGSTYSDEDEAGIDLTKMWVDVATSNTPVKISYVTKQ